MARIELGSDGYLLYLTESDGAETAYSLSDDCEAQYDGDEIKLSAVIGGRVTLTKDEDGIVTLITLDERVGNSSVDDPDATEISGSVLYVNSRDEYYLVEGEEGDVTICVTDSTKYFSSAGSGLTFYGIKGAR